MFVNVSAIDRPSLASVAAVTVFPTPAALCTVKSVASGAPDKTSSAAMVIVDVAFAVNPVKVGRTPSITIA